MARFLGEFALFHPLACFQFWVVNRMNSNTVIFGAGSLRLFTGMLMARSSRFRALRYYHLSMQIQEWIGDSGRVWGLAFHYTIFLRNFTDGNVFQLKNWIFSELQFGFLFLSTYFDFYTGLLTIAFHSSHFEKSHWKNMVIMLNITIIRLFKYQIIFLKLNYP